MKIVISPAKSLNFETPALVSEHTKAVFLKEAAVINDVLKSKSPQDLSQLMHISEKLGELNFERNQNWKLPFTVKNAKQAVYAFTGDVYLGLDVETLSDSGVLLLQKHLRILSGQYGVLKPLDLIQPYRLEMGTKLSIGNFKNLYEFWRDKVTNTLQKELYKDEVLLNLASNEYAKVIQFKKLKNRVVTPVFKDFKNGELKVISFFAKRARGEMVRYIVENNIENVEDLKYYINNSYFFSEEHSNSNEFVFIR